MKLLRLVAINFLVFIALLGASFVAIELWARMQPRSMFVEFDPLLGFRLKPSVEGVYRGLSALTPNPYIRTPVRINSLGLRGPEITLKKPLGTRRVLVLGDSFVEAFEVSYEETFYARLERMAQEHTKHPVEIIPMGVMGYGTAQELLWLREHGTKFQPDLVILLLFLGNDVIDNSRALHFSGGRPYFDLEGDALKLVSLPNAVNRYKYWAAEHIRSFLLYKELGSRFSSFRKILDRFSLDNNAGRGGGAAPTASDPKVYQAFQLTFALIKGLRQTTTAMGSPLLVAYYGDYKTELPQDAQTLTANFCATEALECLNLNPYVTRDEQNVVPGDGHWSVAGHRVVADSLWRQWNHYFIGPDKNETETVSHGTVASVQ